MCNWVCLREEDQWEEECPCDVTVRDLVENHKILRGFPMDRAQRTSWSWAAGDGVLSLPLFWQLHGRQWIAAVYVMWHRTHNTHWASFISNLRYSRFNPGCYSVWLNHDQLIFHYIFLEICIKTLPTSTMHLPELHDQVNFPDPDASCIEMSKTHVSHPDRGLVWWERQILNK